MTGLSRGFKGGRGSPDSTGAPAIVRTFIAVLCTSFSCEPLFGTDLKQGTSTRGRARCTFPSASPTPRPPGTRPVLIHRPEIPGAQAAVAGVRECWGSHRGRFHFPAKTGQGVDGQGRAHNWARTLPQRPRTGETSACMSTYPAPRNQCPSRPRDPCWEVALIPCNHSPSPAKKIGFFWLVVR